MAKLLNFVAFQACWFANVLCAAAGMPWIGPLVAITWLAAHFRLLGERAGPDTRVLLAAGAIGWLADSALVSSGLISFPDVARLGGPSPLWMACLWVAFAATLRHSLGWLRGRWLLGAALGAIGGPLAYSAGEALGAIALSGTPALTAVAVQYAIATPLLLYIARASERAAPARSYDAEAGARS